jgi:predicted dehydrogenase
MVPAAAAGRFRRMTAIVIGQGSIGLRHARVLRGLGHEVIAISRRGTEGTHASLSAALEARPGVEYVVVATETSAHRGALEELARLDFRGTVLVEKPLFDRAGGLPANRFAALFVGYNLRFHPLTRELRAVAGAGEVACVSAYVGQHLSQWRAGADYRAGYSARRDLGGGVLRDLSHDLDYLLWAFGGWRRLVARGGRLGELEIDSEDAVSVMMEQARSPLTTLHMNYLHRPSRRGLGVIARGHTWELDFVAGTLALDGAPSATMGDIGQTYKAQHEAILSGRHDLACSAEEGLDVMRAIEAAELSMQQGRWVERA